MQTLGISSLALENEQDDDEDSAGEFFGYTAIAAGEYALGHAHATTLPTEEPRVVDSGTSRHICRDRGSFVTVRPVSGVILAANGATLQVKGKGQ